MLNSKWGTSNSALVSRFQRPFQPAFKYVNCLLFVWFVAICCTKKKQQFIYEDSSGIYTVTAEKVHADTLYTFYDRAKREIRQVGIYKNSIRNGPWAYVTDSSSYSITWALYQDKYLGYSTNLLYESDSTIYGGWYTKSVCPTPGGPLNIIVGINGALKDSFPEKNYKRFLESDTKGKNFTIVSFKRTNLYDSEGQVFINKGEIKNNETAKRKSF